MKLRYKDWSIFYKILAFFASIIFLLFGLTLFNFYTYYKQTRINSITVLQAAAAQAANGIDAYLSDAAALTKIPLVKTAEGFDVAYVLRNLEDGTISQMEISALHKMLGDILDYKKDVHSVFFLTPTGKAVYDFQFISTINDLGIKDSSWFKELMQSSGQTKILPPFLMSYYEDLIPRADYMFSSGRAIRMVSSNRLTGAIIVNTDIKYLKEIVLNMLSNDNQRVIIADSSSGTIYDTVGENIGKPVPSSLLSILSGEAPPEEIIINGKRCLLGHSRVGKSNWQVFNIMPIAALNMELNTSVYLTVLAIAGICLLAIVITFFISRYIVAPIKELVACMQNINYESFDVDIKADSKDEIGQLKKAFFNMISKIKQLIKEKYTDELQKKELEISMLQMQINPHFLYNTLQSMSMMAEINDDLETSNMTTSLGRIMRYSLGSQSEFVLLSEEIYCLNEYIKLQKERLTNVDFDEHIDYMLYDQKTVRMLLQPVVENSITHGMERTPSGGLITITGRHDNGYIILEVSDNGKGMTNEAAQELNDYINDKNNAFKSIGLKNVNKRIKLYFGEEYGLKIYSDLGKGTKTVITLPFIEK